MPHIEYFFCMLLLGFSRPSSRGQISNCKKLNARMMIEGTTSWEAPDPLKVEDEMERPITRKVVWNYRDVDTIMGGVGQFSQWLFQHQLKRNPLWAESEDGYNERYKFAIKSLCKPLTSKCK
jgi:hypothetical protein